MKNFTFKKKKGNKFDTSFYDIIYNKNIVGHIKYEKWSKDKEPFYIELHTSPTTIVTLVKRFSNFEEAIEFLNTRKDAILEKYKL